MKAILAMSENRAIGKNGALPWPSIKEDFKHFREFTMGKTIVVGRTTFNTLPKLKDIVVGRTTFNTLPKLKDRECYVVTNNSTMSTVGFYTVKENSNGYTGKEINIAYLHGTIKLNAPDSDNWIVAGGAKTYELFLPYITEFYVTHIKGTYDADTYMIPFEHLYNKQEVIKEFDGHRVVKYTK